LYRFGRFSRSTGIPPTDTGFVAVGLLVGFDRGTDGVGEGFHGVIGRRGLNVREVEYDGRIALNRATEGEALGISQAAIRARQIGL